MGSILWRKANDVHLELPKFCHNANFKTIQQIDITYQEMA